MLGALLPGVQFSVEMGFARKGVSPRGKAGRNFCSSFGQEGGGWCQGNPTGSSHPLDTHLANGRALLCVPIIPRGLSPDSPIASQGRIILTSNRSLRRGGREGGGCLLPSCTTFHWTLGAPSTLTPLEHGSERPSRRILSRQSCISPLCWLWGAGFLHVSFSSPDPSTIAGWRAWVFVQLPPESLCVCACVPSPSLSPHAPPQPREPRGHRSLPARRGPEPQ